MDIEVSSNDISASIEALVGKDEKCFLTANTTDYNYDGCCGVTIGDIEVMKKFGWCDKEDVKKLNSMRIGERYDNKDWHNTTAFIIRLG